MYAWRAAKNNIEKFNSWLNIIVKNQTFSARYIGFELIFGTYLKIQMMRKISRRRYKPELNNFFFKRIL
jgi:hypothetical protein